MWQFSNFAKGPHKGLKHLVLGSLSQSPKNGVELMDDVERQTFGFWRPSPGSMYPLLESLSKEGMIEKMPDGRYSLTQKGSRETDSQPWPRFGWPTTVDQMVSEMKNYVSYFEDLGKEKLSPFVSELENLNRRIENLLQK